MPMVPSRNRLVERAMEAISRLGEGCKKTKMMLAEEDTLEAEGVDVLPVGDARIEDRRGGLWRDNFARAAGAYKNSKIQGLIMQSPVCKDLVSFLPLSARLPPRRRARPLP
jgi:hypothetical protein